MKKNFGDGREQELKQHFKSAGLTDDFDYPPKPKCLRV